MTKKFTLAGLLIWTVISLSFSQIPKGSWRDHLAYTRGVYLAITPNKVYYAALKGGMLAYNLKTNEVEKLSKVTGLSDIDISCINYAEAPEVLIIGYSSGNLDLLTHQGKINMPDIARKQMISSKTINRIECYGNIAYLACDFGIVVLDLEKFEIRDSYMFGPEGNTIKVNDLTIYNNYIYAATDLGLYRADLNSENLLDYSNWELLNITTETNTPFKLVEAFGNNLFVAYKNTLTNHDKIIVYQNNNWLDWNGLYDTLINEIDLYQNTLCIAGKQNTRFYNEQLQVLSEYQVPDARHALMGSDGTVYTAGTAYGFYIFEGSQGRTIGVINPRFNNTGIVATKDDYVWVGTGGPFRKYTAGGAYIFENEQWKSFNNGYYTGLEGVGNFYKFAFNPSNSLNVFASGYLFGIYEFDNFNLVNTYTWENTPLFNQTIDFQVQVRAMGLDFDSKGNLWTVMDETDQPVYLLDNNNEWKNIELESSIFSSPNIFVDLEVTENDQIWIVSKINGIAVLKQESDGSMREITFPIKNQDGNLITAAYCISEDKEGQLWIGTNQGPIIYTPTDDIFSSTDLRGYQVKIPRNDGENGADYLLDYEIINDIAVDGGNRKWIATENSGVFLISDDGKKTIHHYTYENDPLFSNNIIGIGIQEKTGEVFISTNYGLLSYMGTSNEGSDEYSNVYVFPNPVRPDFNGDITVNGLIENSNVKITDISGNIVYETTSMGGQAVWNGKNFDGSRVATGVYMVFLSNEDGSKTHVTKLLFIH